MRKVNDPSDQSGHSLPIGVHLLLRQLVSLARLYVLYMLIVDVVPEQPAKSTPLGGLRRLGTVMGRRKSMVVSPSMGFDKKAEKKRSPFAPFKRSDSSREMQIPESPPSTADRPDTAFTNDEPARNPSVSHDQDADAITPAPGNNAMSPPATNGAALDAQPGFSNGTGQV